MIPFLTSEDVKATESGTNCIEGVWNGSHFSVAFLDGKIICLLDDGFDPHVDADGKARMVPKKMLSVFEIEKDETGITGFKRTTL